MISHERVKEVVDYDPETGLFTWKITRRQKNRNPIGSVAGGLTHKGYIEMQIDGKSYKAHHLAWLYMTGNLPNKWIDHRNRIRNDNRIKNLREATPKQNSRNNGGWKKDGLPKGVYRQKNKFQSAIRVDGKLIYLGSFPTKDLAHSAYKASAEKYFGEFSRFV